MEFVYLACFALLVLAMVSLGIWLLTRPYDHVDGRKE